MTNEQLFVLFQTQIGELREALNRCYELMPKDASRVKEGRWQTKPEYEGKILFSLSDQTHEYIQEDTEDYEALVPIQELINEMEYRCSALVKLQELEFTEKKTL